MYNAKAYSAASATSPLAFTMQSLVEIQPNTTCRLRYCTAASVTPTSIRYVTIGAASCPLSTRLSQAMRSSAV